MLRTNISSVWSNSRYHIHIPSCVGFSRFYRNCSDTSPCSNLFIIFNYTFERMWFKRSAASHPITVYKAGAQWRHNMITVLPNIDMQNDGFQIGQKGVCFPYYSIIISKLAKRAIFSHYRDLSERYFENVSGAQFSFKTLSWINKGDANDATQYYKPCFPQSGWLEKPKP